MGLVFLHDDNRKVALIAPTDVNSPEEHRIDKYVVLYHPGYRKGINPVEFPYIEKIGIQSALVNNQQSQLSYPKLQILPDDNYLTPSRRSPKSTQGGGSPVLRPLETPGL